jgi:hypothetical protein
MAIVTWPALRIRSIVATLSRPSQVNRSTYTGARSVAANPWHGKWSFKVQLAPIVGETNFLPVRAFLASLRGATNTFRLPATEGGQAGFGAATVLSTVAQGAVAMTVTGAAVQAGQMITVNDQLLQIVTSTVSGANRAITFEPALRAAATAGTSVNAAAPTCLVALTGSDVGWSVDQGQLYNLSFEVEEAF